MTSRWSNDDCKFMARALALAARGRGFVEPNPMVGCVLVKRGEVVGQGWHKRYGGPHAEIVALNSAGADARGATAYVTLEPCCHVGKTPPCADALIAAGVRRVVAAMQDPNPLVSGRGFRTLRFAGIRCDVGLLNAPARDLNASFISCLTRKRPYVILKWAQSIDGKIATRTGDSKWISSPPSRTAAHELRGRVDAIIIGASTVVMDDPVLTCRLARPKRLAARIVLDPQLRTPLHARLVRTAKRVPTMIVTTAHRRASKKGIALCRAGCDLLELPSRSRKVQLRPLLRALCRRGMSNVLVEGGGRVIGDFVRQGLADEAVIFVAPTLIGGETAPGPLRNIGPATMASLPRVEWREMLHLGPDLCYNLRFG